MRTFIFFLNSLIFLFIIGCSPDKSSDKMISNNKISTNDDNNKPSDKTIQDFVSTKFARKVTNINFGNGSYKKIDFDNVHIINQWPDENLKGIYNIKINYINKFHYLNEKETHISKYETIWRFRREGNQWAPEKSEFENSMIQ